MSGSASAAPLRVCMVCTGNICRSPMADVVLNQLVREANLADVVHVDSAGTHDYHVGDPADPRTVTALAAGGYDGAAHRARQFRSSWFDRYDLILAADRGHLRILHAMARSEDERARVRLLREFDPTASERGELDIDDPYYGPTAGFDRCLHEVEAACRGVLDHLEQRLRADVR